MIKTIENFKLTNNNNSIIDKNKNIIGLDTDIEDSKLE